MKDAVPGTGMLPATSVFSTIATSSRALHDEPSLESDRTRLTQSAQNPLPSARRGDPMAGNHGAMVRFTIWPPQENTHTFVIFGKKKNERKEISLKK